MINIGNSSIENILVGDTQVDRVYLGTDVVWEYLQSIPYDMEVLYLESTEELFIDTGIIPDSNTGIMATITNTTLNQDRYMIGLRNDTGNTRWGIGNNSTKGTPWYYCYGTYELLNVSLDQYHTADVYLNYTNSGVFRVDEYGTSNSISLPQLSFVPLYNIRLFGSAGVVATYTKTACRIHKVKISQGANIIMDLIPVRKDGIGYMYDKVSGRLFGNNGTGNFIVGPDIRDYLKFTALESGTFTLTIPAAVNTSYITSISYSLDNGATWVTTLNSSSVVAITTPTVALGGTVLWKGDGTRTTTSTVNYYCYFSSTGRFNASGNIMSLLYEDNFENVTTILENNCFNRLFLNCLTIVTPPELPATTVAAYAYSNMFYGCTSLEYAPDLPATTISTYSYGYMFANCTSLRRAPAILPSLTVYNQSYYHMFDGCSSLINAPELPATTISGSCYQCMFKNCYLLNTAPSILPATRVYSECYSEMFNGCSSLTNAPELPATELALQCYMYMFLYCSSLINAPELPATTLAPHCYNNMFYGCTNLETAPSVLPATTLVTQCYRWMFGNCGKINRIKALFTTTPTGDYTYSWVSGVSSTGTFVKNPEATWDVRGTNGIPTNWTVETANS